MDATEVEENLLSLGEPKLHGGMCKTLSAIYAKVLAIFPDLEAARPRSMTGIQALCTLHIALEKTKNILQHCAECSKLYLAITGDSIVLKFDKARCALIDSLKRVEDIVPESIGCQISEILRELHGVEFSIDPVEKQVGDEIIALLQLGRKFNNCSDSNELESFHQAASKLSIISSRAALGERRALKKLIERARAEEDKRKESIVAYLSHLMRKYAKLFRSEFSDDNDSQGSTPCSPTVLSPFDGAYSDIDQKISKISSFNFRPNFRRSEQIPVPPEELRCPISLQLMNDPVIIASGQTYERICIEKWFSDGHNTCPKTQQHLSHLSLTPNYCVKGLVGSWCDQNGVPVPDGPPEALDLNYWRLALSERESENSRSMESPESCKFRGVKVVPLEESVIIEEGDENEREEACTQEEDSDVTSVVRYEEFLAALNRENDLKSKCKVVKQIRCLLKDDEEARIYMGANGFVEPLIQFLDFSVNEKNQVAQETVAMALFNLAVNNDRNKEIMLSAGLLPVLERMMSTSSSVGAVTALYLNLSCLEEAKLTIGTSEAVPFLVEVLDREKEPRCRLDALHALFNLSSQSSIIPHLLSAGIFETFQVMITNPDDNGWTEKCIPVLINLCSSGEARDKIAATPSVISALTTVLDSGEPVEQEQAITCLLLLCNGDETCSQIVLQEGVIPSLVSISVNGTMRGKQKAQRLLMLFREQRQREQPPRPPAPSSMNPKLPTELSVRTPDESSRPLSKSTSKRVPMKPWRFWSKNKSFAI